MLKNVPKFLHAERNNPTRKSPPRASEKTMNTLAKGEEACSINSKTEAVNSERHADLLQHAIAKPLVFTIDMA